MNSTHSRDQNGLQPGVSAEQAMKGVLALIRNNKQAVDFTPEQLNRAFHATVALANDDSGRYGFGGSISSDWNYNVEVDNKVVDLQGRQWSKFNFSFDPAIAGTYPDIGHICTPGFDNFTSELESMGFKREHYYGEHGRWIYDEFNNGSMRIHVYLQGKAEQAPGKTGNACVKMIEIW